MSLLEQFDYLRNKDFQKRQEATLRIFEILDISSKPSTAVSSLDELKEAYGPNVQYTYGRLTKGLASNRESARLGFSAALSELLRALQDIDVDFVIESIVRTTTVVGNTKGQEIRDGQFGRLFGIQAIVTSGILTKPGSKMEDISHVLTLLYELAMSKGWLRESCANVIIAILDSVVKQNSALQAECAQTIHEMLQTSQLTKTIEGVAIELKCQQVSSIKVDQSWHKGNILHADNLPILNKLLRDQGSNESKEKEEKEEKEAEEDLQTGTWKPKLHFAWQVILQAILDDPAADHIRFEDFWRIVVDEGLFSANASHERKYWGLQLFNDLIGRLSVDLVPMLFTQNFMRTLSNQIAQQDRYLNKAAKTSVAALITAAESNQSKVPAILRALWSHNFFFDRLSKDKPCEKLLAQTSSETTKEIFSILKEQCNPPQSKAVISKKDVENRRQYAADCLMMLYRAAHEHNDPTSFDILSFFLTTGYFQINKSKLMPFVFTPDLSMATREVFRTRLQSAIGQSMPTSPKTLENPLVLRVVKEFQLYREKKYFALVLQPDAAIVTLLRSAESAIDDIAARQGSRQQDSAFQLLYGMAIMDIYAGEAEAGQVLEDLNECYEQLSKNAARETKQDEVAAMLDFLLGLLSRESLSYRKLVNTVFTVFAPQMTREAMQLLLRVIEADKDGETLFDKADAGDDLSDGEIEEDDDMLDGDDDDDESNDDEEDVSGIDPEEANAERDAALDAALAAALGGKKRKASELDGQRPLGEGHESDFEADSDEEEDLMNDEQMLAMDETLANIFKRQKKEHTNTKKQDRVQMRIATDTFKRKVLDLLETFVKTCPSSELNLDIILPALSSARKSSEKQYVDKALGLLRHKLFKNKILPSTTRTVDELQELLSAVHAEAERSNTPPQVMAASQASLFVTKVLVQKDNSEDAIMPVVKIYAASQVRWLNHKNSKLTANFFTEFINWGTQWRTNRHKATSAQAQQSAKVERDEEELKQPENATQDGAKHKGKKKHKKNKQDK